MRRSSRVACATSDGGRSGVPQPEQHRVGDVGGGVEGDGRAGVDDDGSTTFPHDRQDGRAGAVEDAVAQHGPLGLEFSEGLPLEGGGGVFGLTLALGGGAFVPQFLEAGLFVVVGGLQGPGAGPAGGAFVEDAGGVDDDDTLGADDGLGDRGHFRLRLGRDGLDRWQCRPHHAHLVTDPVYAWRGLRFVAPAGWRDDTLVTLTAPGAAMNLTVSQDTLPGSQTVEAYARAQEAAVASQRLAGYRAIAPHTVRIGSVDAVVCERELNDARGQPLVQRQAFVVVGTTVAIVTATARAADKVAASAALDRVVASLASSSAGDL